MPKVKLLVPDTHVSAAHRRYDIGDTATVIEHKSRLASDRWWHYKVKLDEQRLDPEGRVMSTICYLTKNQVETV